MLVFIHIVALHEVGSNKQTESKLRKNKDENGIPKDIPSTLLLSA